MLIDAEGEGVGQVCCGKVCTVRRLDIALYCVLYTVCLGPPGITYWVLTATLTLTWQSYTVPGAPSPNVTLLWYSPGPLPAGRSFTGSLTVAIQSHPIPCPPSFSLLRSLLLAEHSSLVSYGTKRHFFSFPSLPPSPPGPDGCSLVLH